MATGGNRCFAPFQAAELTGIRQSVVTAPATHRKGPEIGAGLCPPLTRPLRESPRSIRIDSARLAPLIEVGPTPGDGAWTEVHGRRKGATGDQSIDGRATQASGLDDGRQARKHARRHDGELRCVGKRNHGVFLQHEHHELYARPRVEPAMTLGEKSSNGFGITGSLGHGDDDPGLS
jgi:hypothetical protein